MQPEKLRNVRPGSYCLDAHESTMHICYMSRSMTADTIEMLFATFQCLIPPLRGKQVFRFLACSYHRTLLRTGILHRCGYSVFICLRILSRLTPILPSQKLLFLFPSRLLDSLRQRQLCLGQRDRPADKPLRDIPPALYLVGIRGATQRFRTSVISPWASPHRASRSMRACFSACAAAFRSALAA